MLFGTLVHPYGANTAILAAAHLPFLKGAIWNILSRGQSMFRQKLTALRRHQGERLAEPFCYCVADTQATKTGSGVIKSSGMSA